MNIFYNNKGEFIRLSFVVLSYIADTLTLVTSSTCHGRQGEYRTELGRSHADKLLIQYFVFGMLTLELRNDLFHDAYRFHIINHGSQTFGK